MQSLARALLKADPSIQIYYLLPGTLDHEWEIKEDWLLKDGRITYHQVPHHRNRMYEYRRFDRALEDFYMRKGKYADWDIAFTGRASLVPLIIEAMGGQRKHKKIVIMEDLPVSSIKKRLTHTDADHQDRLLLTAYLGADRVFMFSYASKAMLLDMARTHLSPSKVRELSQKIVEQSSVQFGPPKYKPPKQIKETASHKKKFTFLFTQRLSGRDFARGDFPFMRGHGVTDNYLRGAIKVLPEAEYLWTTNSRAAPKEWTTFRGFLQIKQCNREEFWDVIDNRADVIMSQSKDEDYPLSILEPIMRGVPAIIRKVDYAVPTYGADYPFYAENEAQFLGWMKRAYDDYEGFYAIHTNWMSKKFAAIMAERDAHWFVFDARDLCKEHKGLMTGWPINALTKDLIAFANKQPGNTIQLANLCEAARKAKVSQYKPVFYPETDLGMGIALSDIRLGFIAAGWQDTGYLTLTRPKK